MIKSNLSGDWKLRQFICSDFIQRSVNMQNQKEKSFLGVEQLSLRSLCIGALGSIIITASSMYVSLRMSALPWPTIFVAVLSMAVLKGMGKTTNNEINITQTAMSAGAMVAGGLAFTLPGLWITGTWKDISIKGGHFYLVLLIAFAGMILGTVLTVFLRPRFVEGEQLPYPIGTAAAETIKTGDKVGKKFGILFGNMGVSAVFTYLRDSLGVIPASLSSKFLYSRNIYAGIWLSPMAIGIGYIIGALFTGLWFLGAVISYFGIIPIGVKTGIFATAQAASAFKNTLGIGLMVGTGIGILISFLISLFKQKKVNKTKTVSAKTSRIGKVITILAVVAAWIISIICGLGPIASVLLILGAFLTAAMAATITGQTGINPMEIFGIIILLAIRLVVPVSTTGAFLIAACVAVSCGYAGDLLNEYKAGYILGTNPKAQLISQIVGGIVGTFVAAFAMFAIIGQFGGVGADKGLPAGQAFAVSQMVGGIGNITVFTAAAVLGALLYLLKIPAMTLGLGVYLPFEISSAVFIGGALRFISDKFRPSAVENGSIAASGLLGGEGVTGVAVAIAKMLVMK